MLSNLLNKPLPADGWAVDIWKSTGRAFRAFGDD